MGELRAGSTSDAPWGSWDAFLAVAKVESGGWTGGMGITHGSRLGGGGLVRDVRKWVCSAGHKKGKGFMGAQKGQVGSCLSPRVSSGPRRASGKHL